MPTCFDPRDMPFSTPFPLSFNLPENTARVRGQAGEAVDAALLLAQDREPLML